MLLHQTQKTGNRCISSAQQLQHIHCWTYKAASNTLCSVLKMINVIFKSAELLTLKRFECRVDYKILHPPAGCGVFKKIKKQIMH